MLARGVRRSCETASRSADFSASLSRAISVSVAARRRSSRRSASAELVGGQREQARLLRGSAAPVVRGSLGTEPAERAVVRVHPDLEKLAWRSDAGADAGRRRSPRGTATHLAGCSPGIRTSVVLNGEAGNGSPGRESARTTGPLAPVARRSRPARAARRGRARSTIPAPAVSMSGAVARRRLIANSDGRLRGAAGGFLGALAGRARPAARRRSRRTGTAAGRATRADRRREAEPRLGEDEVVDEERGDRGPERRPQPVAQAGDDDRDEVDGRRVLQADGRAFEEGDDSRGNAKRRRPRPGLRSRTRGRSGERIAADRMMR